MYLSTPQTTAGVDKSQSGIAGFSQRYNQARAIPLRSTQIELIQADWQPMPGHYRGSGHRDSGSWRQQKLIEEPAQARKISERQHIGNVLIGSNNDQRTCVSFDLAGIENIASAAGIRTKNFFIIDQAVFTLARQEQLGQRFQCCLLYTSPSPRDQRGSRMPSSA